MKTNPNTMKPYLRLSNGNKILDLILNIFIQSNQSNSIGAIGFMYRRLYCIQQMEEFYYIAQSGQNKRKTIYMSGDKT